MTGKSKEHVCKGIIIVIGKQWGKIKYFWDGKVCHAGFMTKNIYGRKTDVIEGLCGYTTFTGYKNFDGMHLDKVETSPKCAGCFKKLQEISK